MTNKISTTLKTLMEQKEINTSELARRTGVAQPVIYRIVSGETDNPKLNTLIPLASYFDIHLDNLVTGLNLQNPESKNTTKKSATSRIPLLSWDQIRGRNFHRAETWYVTQNNTISATAFGLTVKDTYLQPAFPLNTIMIFDSALQPENEDIILIAKQTQNPCIKRYLLDGSDAYLKPIRPELSAKPLEKNEPLEILGVLVESTTFYKGKL